MNKESENTKNAINTNNKFNFKVFFDIALLILLVFADQFSKYLAVTKLKNGNPKVLLNNILHLVYVENKGIAWSLLSGKVDFIVIFTTIISLVLVFFIIRISHRIMFLKTKMDNQNENEDEDDEIFLKIVYSNITKYSFIVILAGAIGNIIDRVRLGYVIDFIYFKIIDFPVFNVADIFVTVGMAVFIIVYIFKIDENDVMPLFKSSKKWN